ncbi:hypothetical protein V1502_16480 [Bacillus sp. SCS-153A]|uniref:hypothetical protein n=1 Tax=Rossellomorea sedimentorum TaxID=3115294 RepID=UPI0039067816
MKNKQIYEAIHDHIGQGRVFSKEEEHELLNKIREHDNLNSRKRWFPELIGWSLAAAALLITLSAIGTQIGLLPFSTGGQPEVLDTSLLKESKISGLENMSEEEKEHFLNRSPKSYYADSTEDALKAIPFKLTLPEELPIEGEFVVTDIKDWHFDSNSDGKDISIDLIAGGFKNKMNNNTIMISASDFNKVISGEDSKSVQEVQLNHGIKGRVDITHTGGSIRFKNRFGIEITIVFNHEANEYDTQKELINLANQMIE